MHQLQNRLAEQMSRRNRSLQNEQMCSWQNRQPDIRQMACKTPEKCWKRPFLWFWCAQGTSTLGRSGMWWGGIVHPPLAAAALLVALDGWLPSNAERCSLGDNAERCSLGGAWQIHVFSRVFITQIFTYISLADSDIHSVLCHTFVSILPALRQCSACIS